MVSVILVLLYQVVFIKEKIVHYTKNSIVFPFMLDIGKKIINISPDEIEKNIKNVKISIN